MSEKITFEQANDKLSAIVAEMESGELSLEESMKLYDEAFKLLSFCYAELDKYKGEITDINTRINEMRQKGDIIGE